MIRWRPSLTGERFNGRIEEVLQSQHFRAGEELETTLHHYVPLYNQQLPQSALGSKTLRANKSETFERPKFTLEGAGEQSDGYAFNAAQEHDL